MPTVPQTQSILQGYFQTGDVPTQDQFLELIGTMFYLYNEMVTLANTINGQFTTIEEQLGSQAPAVVCSGTVSETGFSGDFSIAQVGSAFGISSITVNADTGVVTLAFSEAFANTTYKILTWGAALSGTTLATNGMQFTCTGTFTIIIWS